MTRFHVSAGWRTETGRLASCDFVTVSRNMSEAMLRARLRIEKNRRYRYAGKLHISAIMLEEV